MHASTATCWKPSETYQPRPIQCREVRERDGWRLKVYTIRYGQAPLERAAYEEVFPQVWASLPRPAQTAARPGVGFVILHQGRGVHFLVLCWWDNENEFLQRVFIRRFGPDQAWRLATAGESACVWDLQVVWFERQAYVETVLTPPTGADLEAYLARRLEVPG